MTWMEYGDVATPVTVLLAVIAMLIKERRDKGRTTKIAEHAELTAADTDRQRRLAEANNRMLWALCRAHPETREAGERI